MWVPIQRELMESGILYGGFTEYACSRPNNAIVKEVVEGKNISGNISKDMYINIREHNSYTDMIVL